MSCIERTVVLSHLVRRVPPLDIFSDLRPERAGHGLRGHQVQVRGAGQAPILLQTALYAKA